MMRPDIPYGLSGHRVSIGICKAGPQAGCCVACFRYVTPNVPDWFMVEFGDGQGSTDPDAEMDFDDVAELDDYLDDLEVIWFADHEAQDALRKTFPAHPAYPRFLEQIIAWVSAYRWRHKGL